MEVPRRSENPLVDAILGVNLVGEKSKTIQFPLEIPD